MMLFSAVYPYSLIRRSIIIIDTDVVIPIWDGIFCRRCLDADQLGLFRKRLCSRVGDRSRLTLALAESAYEHGWEAQRIVASMKLRRARVGDFCFFEASDAARWKGVARWKLSILAVAVWTYIRSVLPHECYGLRPRERAVNINFVWIH
jgi:hypothetical protein